MKINIRWIVLVALMLTVVGCNSIVDNSPDELPETNTPESVIVNPTHTPEIEYPPTILLFADEETDLAFINDIQEIVQLVADQNEWVYEFRSNLNGSPLPQNLKAMVMIADEPNILELIGESNGVKILSVGLAQEADLIPNLTLIDLPENGQAVEGFVAGYIAAMQTEEWRVGMLGFADQSDYRIGFINGAIYFCGLCLPQYPPYEDYPLFVEVNDGAEFEELKAGVDLLVQKDIQIVYLAPGTDDSELILYLSQLGINMIGNQRPPSVPETLWIASVSWDWLSAVEDALPKMLSDDYSNKLAPKILVGDVDQNVFSLSRQTLVYEIIENLADGIIDPLGE